MFAFRTDHILDHVPELLACDVEWRQILWFRLHMSLDEGLLWIDHHNLGLL